MMATDFGPCPWPLTQCSIWPAGSEAVTGYAVTGATEVLWQLSGQRYGLCEATLRPCRKTCGDGDWLGGWWQWGGAGMWPRPLLYNGQWFNIACGSCAGDCSCTTVEEVQLPGPVHSVTQVIIDGVVLSPSAYRLDNWDTLIRLDGGRWPVCQDMSAADDADGAFAVTILWGEEVPIIGQQALGQLAHALVRECMGDDCKLPKNVTSMVRQGVTITLPEDWLQALTFVGLFLRYANPYGLPGAPQIYDPDDVTFRRTNT